MEDAGKVNILLVDDRPSNLSSLQALLDRPDYNLVLADSGEEALNAVLHQDFAVILLDVAMPGMDGFETASLIKKRERSSRIPIIFITASIYDLDHIYKGYSVGAVDYLQKPIAPEMVRAKVAVFVELYRQRDQIERQEGELREAERRRAEQALRESEAQYEATFEQAAIGIAHADTEANWRRANPRFCDLLGYKCREILKLRFEDLIHADDLPRVAAALGRLLRGEIDIYRAETRCRHRRGTALWANLTISVLRNDDGLPKKFLALIEDVSEHKRAQERQRVLGQASEALLSSLDYRSTLAHVAELVVPTLADWCVVDLTAGGSEERRPIVAHGDPGAVARYLELRSRTEPVALHGMSQVLSTREPLLIPRIDGGETAAWGASSVAALHELGVSSMLMVPILGRSELQGVLTWMSGAHRRCDEADLAAAEDLAHRVAFAVDNALLYQAAQDAIAARDDFLSVASHELRTPLTPLQIKIQRLIGDHRRVPRDPTPDEMRATLRSVDRQVQRLVDLIDDLLDVTRITSGRLKLRPEELDLAELTREVVGRFAEEMAATGSPLELKADAPVVGRWDSLRLEQVVSNLVSNAIKYGEGKPIEVAVGAEGGRARLRVHDGGIGIPAEKLAQIFGRFERAVSSRSYGGLGLGLYIARQIVEAHGGRITVRSEPGAGSVFMVELPLEALREEESAAGGAERA